MNLYEHYSQRSGAYIVNEQWDSTDIEMYTKWVSQFSIRVKNKPLHSLRQVWSILLAVDGITCLFPKQPFDNMLRLLRMAYPSSVRNDIWQEWQADLLTSAYYLTPGDKHEDI